MLVAVRKLNHRNITLDPVTHDRVAVLLKTGEYRYLTWCGFLDRTDIPSSANPAKLLISRIGMIDGVRSRWQDVPEGRHIEGVRVGNKVWAVVDRWPRIV